MKKVAVVDGNSLYHMAKDLGYHTMSALTLHHFLSDIGDGSFSNQPLFTYYEGFSTSVIIENFKLAGFDVRLTPKGTDDDLIIQHIRSINVEEVQELILVTQDSDFLESVTEKCAAGLKVYWVGSMNAVKTETLSYSLGIRLRNSFRGNLSFVEIENLKYKIFYNRKRRSIT